MKISFENFGDLENLFWMMASKIIATDKKNILKVDIKVTKITSAVYLFLKNFAKFLKHLFWTRLNGFSEE